jgi:micrococcal nuclease
MPQKRLLSLLSVLFLLGAFGVWQADWSYLQPSKKQERADLVQATTTVATATTTQIAKIQTNAEVVRVVDGDTLDVKLDSEPDKEYKVRLLGVNTPETVDPRRPVQCFGKEASDFTKHALNGKRIRLEADSQADERDKYGRLLRNLYLEDGTDFNAKLVAEGYAYAYISFPQDPQRKVELRKLEKSAKEAKLGLWNPEACPQ